MMPTELDECEGGTVVFHMGPDSSKGIVTGWDPPRRIVYEEDWATLMGQDPTTVTPLVSEFLVEATSGGSCVLRVVTSAFGSGRSGNASSSPTCRSVGRRCSTPPPLPHAFPGATAAVLEAATDVSGTPAAALSSLRRSIGVDHVGQTVEVRDTIGQVEKIGEQNLLVRVNEPVPGMLSLATFQTGENTTSARLAGYLFSHARARTSRARRPRGKRGWRTWLRLRRPVAHPRKDPLRLRSSRGSSGGGRPCGATVCRSERNRDWRSMAEREVEVNGGIVVYEFIGPDDGEVVVITPGGRFSKDHGGVHELADALADGGKRVLLWDRPNCGKSDVQVYGRSESHMRAETLGLMLQKLGVEQVIAAGGSGGARDSIIFTIMWPDLVRKLRCGPSSVARTARWCSRTSTSSTSSGPSGRGESKAILEMEGPAGSWSDLVSVNPRNRDRLLAIGSEEFERVMNRWLDPLIPKPNEAIPGVPDWEFEQIECPTLIIRGGEKDYDHPPRTSYEVHALIKGSRLIEPPWPEDAWECVLEKANAGQGSVFDPWVQAAPVLLDFIDEP